MNLSFKELQKDNEFLGTSYVESENDFKIDFAHGDGWDVWFILHSDGTYSVEISHF